MLYADIGANSEFSIRIGDFVEISAGGFVTWILGVFLGVALIKYIASGGHRQIANVWRKVFGKKRRSTKSHK